MNPSDKELLLQRFVDGELNEAERGEIERLLETDPELRAEAESLARIGSAMRAGLSPELEPPSADFFNAHILRQIDAEHPAPGSAGDRAGGSAVRARLSWPGVPWAVAVAAVVFAAILWLQDHGGDGQAIQSAGLDPVSVEGLHSRVKATYTPVAGVRADSFFSDEAQATVIRLSGLEELPPEREVAGHAAVGYRPDPEGGSIELRDGEGMTLLVMRGGAAGRPPVFF